MRNLFIGASLLMVGGSMLNAESEYVAPQATRLMFQVDKLPMDKGMRKWLSQQLTIMSKREHDSTEKEQLLTAQLLMLAMRVDSENHEAHKVNQDLTNGQIPPVVDNVEIMKAIQRVEQIIKNLSQTDSENEAQTLTVYLKDVLLSYDPDNSLVTDHQYDHSRWQGILPELTPVENVAQSDPEDNGGIISQVLNNTDLSSLFGSVSNSENNEGSVTGNQLEAGKEVTNNNEQEKNAAFTRWKPHKSAITVPLLVEYKEGEHKRNRTDLVRMNVSITPQGQLNSTLNLKFTPHMEHHLVESFRGLLSGMMKRSFGEFESVKIEINAKDLLHPNTRPDVVLPVCLQLMASARGIDIREGSMVLGKLEGSEIKRSWDFWAKLKYLLPEDANAGRLLIPLEAEPDLTQLVALEQESFFVRNEVLLVTNVEEAVDLLGDSANTDFREASANFAKIQEIIGSKSVGPFAVNKKIRQQLELILRKNPNHLSAKMILLRGDTARSKRLDRYFLAQEVSYIINDMNWLIGAQGPSVYSPNLVKEIKEIEAFQDKYNRYIDSDDRDLIAYLSDISDIFELIIRSKKKQESKINQRIINGALVKFSNKHKEAKATLDGILKTLPNLAK